MADHRQRAERLAAALGLRVRLTLGEHGTLVVCLDGGGTTALKTNAATDANAWRWAAEHLAARAAEAAGPALAAAADEAERARLAAQAVATAWDETTALAAEHARRAAELRAASDAATRERYRAEDALADALAAATPEQRAAWDALREGD